MADLTTLAAVKADLKITDTAADTVLAALITAVSAEFEHEVGHAISSTTHTAQALDGNGRDSLVLPDYPIVSVSALTVDGEVIAARATVTGDGYVIEAASGRLRLVGYTFAEGIQNVVVTYSAGYSTVPKEIEQAVRETVVTKYKADPNAQTQIASAGGEYTQFRQPFVWPAFAFEVLKAYRRPSVG